MLQEKRQKKIIQIGQQIPDDPCIIFQLEVLNLEKQIHFLI